MYIKRLRRQQECLFESSDDDLPWVNLSPSMEYCSHDSSSEVICNEDSPDAKKNSSEEQL